MDDDRNSAAERIAALNARRATGAVRPPPAQGARSHAARGARRVTLLASVVAVAGLTGGFALNAASNSTPSVAAATKTVATTNTTTAPTTASTNATTAQTSAAQAVTTSQGS
jgi:hypothetical protein